jgi:hypothetical protein
MKREPFGVVIFCTSDPRLASLYTSKFFRRSWYSEKKKAHTARLPLTGADLQQLVAFLGKYQIGARLVLNGLRWDGKMLAPTTQSSRFAAKSVEGKG